MAAFGTRRAVRFAQWRGQREAHSDAPTQPSDQVFRGFLQINVIHPR